MMAEVRVADLNVTFDGTPAVRQLGVSVPAGGWLGVVGPNGAGKTTLLRAVAGLVRFDGDIVLGDESVAASTRRRLAQLVAYVPQRPTLPDAVLVADYVLLGRNPYISFLGTESESDLRVVRAMLERLELTAFSSRPLGSLSGGESQRAVLARALAQQAPILLLDEPTAALDVGHQLQALELIDELRIERGLSVVAAMHDLSLAGQFSDRILMMAEGRAVMEGAPDVVLTQTRIQEHFGATVRIEQGPGGHPVVIPVRSGHVRAEALDGNP